MLKKCLCFNIVCHRVVYPYEGMAIDIAAIAYCMIICQCQMTRNGHLKFAWPSYLSSITYFPETLSYSGCQNCYHGFLNILLRVLVRPWGAELKHDMIFAVGEVAGLSYDLSMLRKTEALPFLAWQVDRPGDSTGAWSIRYPFMMRITDFRTCFWFSKYRCISIFTLLLFALVERHEN